MNEVFVPPICLGIVLRALSYDSTNPQLPETIVGQDRLELSANGLRVRCSTN